MKKHGFTLAEVLITLGIIGVVAALVMPSLMANYKKQETVTRLKKAYSALYQAYNLSQAQNGDAADWTNRRTTAADNEEFLNKYMFPYIKTVKICKGANVADCGFDDNKKYLDGSSPIFLNAATYGMAAVLADGVSIYFTSLGGPTYIVMLVDVNGNKPPNIVGKDIFCMNFFYNGVNGFVMLGSQLTDRNQIVNGSDTSPTYGCNKGGEGVYCGGLIQYDGWEIAPDYPW